METFPTFNKRRDFNKAIGPEKKLYKINKRRAYVYSGLENNFPSQYDSLEILVF